MSDQITISNMALSALGVSTLIQDLSEDSVEANACNMFFDQARQELLAGYAWNFASYTVALSLVSQNPTPQWAYSYAYPANAFRIQKILGPVRNEQRKDRISWHVESDGNGGMLIFTDYQDTTNGTLAVITIDDTDPTHWTPAFVKAVSYLLASYVGPRVTSGDPLKLADRCDALAQRAMRIAEANAGNDEQPEPLPPSEFITARGESNVRDTFAGSFIDFFGSPP